MIHSYSAVKLHEQCARKYKFIRIDKLKDSSGEAANRGKLIHEELEAILKGGLPLLSEEIAHLEIGMIMDGVVSNVTNFGAFVDIGVHQDGLVHISAMTNRFITDPRAVVKAGDVVTVKVVEVDKERRRIGLTMKLEAEKPEPKKVVTPSVKPAAKNNKPVQMKKPIEKTVAKKNTVFNTSMADALSKLKRTTE